jgi:hypothetical protein
MIGITSSANRGTHLQKSALRPEAQAAEAVEKVYLAGFVQLDAHGITPSSKYWIHDFYNNMPGNICIAINKTFDTPITIILKRTRKKNEISLIISISVIFILLQVDFVS